MVHGSYTRASKDKNKKEKNAENPYPYKEANQSTKSTIGIVSLVKRTLTHSKQIHKREEFSA